MFLPVTSSPAAAAGMGYFRRMDAHLQDAEFYPPPYNSDAPVDLGDVYGMGDWSDTLTADSVIGGVPNWMLGAGALLAFVFIGSRSGKRDAVRKARSEYDSKLARIDKEYTVAGKARKVARRIPRVRVA